MTGPFSIELAKLRKVYPRKVSDQLVSVGMAALGRPSSSERGGVALNGLSLSIRHGERVGIIGRNGAGKSTLLQMLAGVTEPTSGTMTISGKVTAVLTLGVGLRDDLSGRENIYLDGEAQGKSRAAMSEDVNAIVEFSELGRFIDLPVRTYSTGMKARLAFAMITQIKPEILIIDEALSVGDAAFAVKAGRRIAELCARGAIVLIVSHSMQSIRELCNRCLWLDAGRLVMDGTPDDVTRAYLEKVRAEDEAEHVSRFRSLVGVKNHALGFELAPLVLSVDGQEVRRLVSGARLQIRCGWRAHEPPKGVPPILRCIRLDGSLICEHQVPVPVGQVQGEVRMAYPCFNLAPGLYRLQLEWRSDNGSVQAESAAVVEVIAEEVPTGGRPVLLDVGAIEGIPEKESV
jgi:lipopolysaccharide transport system ATP-binding protein